jgi:cytochrome c oxidase subunit 1
VLSGCFHGTRPRSERLAYPKAASDRSEAIFDLWVGEWIAAGIIGFGVFGLIMWSVLRYRRKSDDHIPPQLRYNLPIEVLYTVAPIIVIAVVFFHTVQAQQEIDETSENPDHVITVVGQKWGWTFIYRDEDAVGGESVFDVGTPETSPSCTCRSTSRPLRARVAGRRPLVLGPEFYYKLDVFPGENDNAFEMTPTRTGTFRGRCAELCGTYHSRMLFDANVVSAEEYEQHLADCRTPARSANRPAPATATTSRATRRRWRDRSERHHRHPGHRCPCDDRAQAEPDRHVAMTYLTDRPQGHRQDVPRHVVRVLPPRRRPGPDHQGGAGPAGQPAGRRGDLQPAVHDARHDHAAAVRDTAVRRFRQLRHAAADRRPRRRLPALNMFSYWLFLFGGLIASAGFIVPGGAASFGWTAYTPLSDAIHSPGVGGDLWIMGLYLGRYRHDPRCGQLHHHDLHHAGARHDDVPDADLHLEHPGDQHAGSDRVPDPGRCAADARGRPAPGCQRVRRRQRRALLWQHLFWFFGHPEVYIIALPFFGIITEILPVFSRKPIFGYIGLVAATLTIAAYSVAVWAHHMFVTGGIDLYFFSFTTFLIAIPTGVKFFNWIGTMWGGSVRLDSPMLWSVGFLVTFLFGGLTGIILATPALDFQLSDSYFVVAHFHYVVFGTVVFAMFAGFYFWWPKLTGRLLDERLAKIHFWLLFVGFHMTFLVQHWLGAEGMPRRYADYWATDNFTLLNQISSVGAFLLGASMIPFAYNLWKSRNSPMVNIDDPWGWGARWSGPRRHRRRATTS